MRLIQSQPHHWQAVRTLCLMLPVIFLLQVASAEEMTPLTLSDAEQLALGNDPVIAANVARSEALDADAVADAQLPDPKFRTGLYNVPLDDFDLQRVPTTQLRLGVQQRFPRGNTLEYKSLKTQAEAQTARRKAALEQQKILRDVRKTYLDTYYQVEVAHIIRSSRQLFESLTEITEVQYASGGSSQQDVLRAELELSRLDDRITQVQAKEDAARARLSRWLGQAAWQPLAATLPEMPEPPDDKQIIDQLEQHPEIRLQAAKIETHQQAVAIAKEQYKPGWTVGAEYRKRFGDNPDGSDRADMAAVMLAVDLPFFTEKRQDQRLKASQKRAAAASLDRVNSRRTLRERLARDKANRQRLSERLQRYEDRLLKEAEENANAALQAYQSGTTDFTALMRARITELDIHVQALKLRVDLLKTKANLLYLAAGDKQ